MTSPDGSEKIGHSPVDPMPMGGVRCHVLIKLKRHWRELRKGRPGRRFEERYERNRKGRKDQSFLQRFLAPAAGIVLLVAGVVFCVIPGPGLPLIIVGASLLGGQSRFVAKIMDWLEVRVRKVARWALGWWQQASLLVKNAVILIAACGLAGVGYGAYHFMFR